MHFNELKCSMVSNVRSQDWFIYVITAQNTPMLIVNVKMTGDGIVVK